MLFKYSLTAAAGLAAALSACSTYAPPPAGPIPTEPGDPPFPSLPADAVVATEPAQIVGSWQSSGLVAPGMRVDIEPNRIVASFGCLTRAWTYRFDGPRIVVATDPIISCQRMESPAEAEGFMQIDRATTVYHRGGRGLVLRGSGSQLVLTPR